MEKAVQNGGDSDQDFDPTAEMLVNDFDDEHTLEEEEAMEESGESNELDDLQKEGDMPLDALLAMYGYAGNTKSTPPPTPKEPPLKVPPLILPCIPPPTTTSVPPPPPPPTTTPVLPKVAPLVATTEDKQATQPKINEKPFVTYCPTTTTNTVTTTCTPSTRHLLRACKSVSQPSESSGSESDDDGSPDDDWRKTIQVGSDYQAVVPEGLCKYDGAPAYENEDRLLWDPAKLQNNEGVKENLNQVEEYLHQAQQNHSTNPAQGVYVLPVGSHTRDDEQALYLLLQCGHNREEALRRRRMQPTHPTDTMSLWSEEECRSFENGLRMYGKDFHLIQQNKVRTRSVGELVQFYYLWKKTERHDVFASKTRLEKKKYALHPGTTDYMDRFLDEQENPSLHNNRDRSSSPNMQSLLYGDLKRFQGSRGSITATNHNLPANELRSSAHPQNNNHSHHQTTASSTEKTIVCTEHLNNGVDKQTNKSSWSNQQQNNCSSAIFNNNNSVTETNTTAVSSGN